MNNSKPTPPRSNLRWSKVEFNLFFQNQTRLNTTPQLENYFMSMNVLDLFCGCGGISYGFKLAGFNIAGGIDHDEDSVLTFAKNFPNSIAPPQDLTDYSDQKILSDFGNKNIDILVGGPPCQGFSSANRWQKEESDPRNKLFFDFIRVAKLLKPKVILVENVRVSSLKIMDTPKIEYYHYSMN